MIYRTESPISPTVIYPRRETSQTASLPRAGTITFFFYICFLPLGAKFIFTLFCDFRSCRTRALRFITSSARFIKQSKGIKKSCSAKGKVQKKLSLYLYRAPIIMTLKQPPQTQFTPSYREGERNYQQFIQKESSIADYYASNIILLCESWRRAATRFRGKSHQFSLSPYKNHSRHERFVQSRAIWALSRIDSLYPRPDALLLSPFLGYEERLQQLFLFFCARCRRRLSGALIKSISLSLSPPPPSLSLSLAKRRRRHPQRGRERRRRWGKVSASSASTLPPSSASFFFFSHFFFSFLFFSERNRLRLALKPQSDTLRLTWIFSTA